MEKKIPSIEEFLASNEIQAEYNGEVDCEVYTKYEVRKLLVGFTKLHVEACKKAAYENAEVYQHKKEDAYDYPTAEHFSVTKNSILNSYPLENIK